MGSLLELRIISQLFHSIRFQTLPNFCGRDCSIPHPNLHFNIDLKTTKALDGNHQRIKYRCIISSFQQSAWDKHREMIWKVLDPRVAADATMVIESGARSIDFARQCCEEKQVRFPDQLLIHVPRSPKEHVLCFHSCTLFLGVPWSSEGRWGVLNICCVEATKFPLQIVARYQADNCVRETKNGHLLRFLCWLCSSHRIRLGALLFGRVGHTHGCLGCWANCWNSTLSNLRGWYGMVDESTEISSK